MRNVILLVAVATAWLAMTKAQRKRLLGVGQPPPR
jgi:hypothetical protein